MKQHDESFELLLSAWLDARNDDALRTAVLAAAGDADRSAEAARWQRLDDALRAALAPPTGVDWEKLRQSIRAQIDRELDAAMVSDDRLSNLLRRETATTQRVDWTHVHAQVSAQAAHRTRRHRLVAFRNITGGFALLAAAAAIVIAFFPKLWSPRIDVRASESATPMHPLAFVAAGIQRSSPAQPETARVVLASYTRLESETDADGSAEAAESDRDDLFVMIDPLDSPDTFHEPLSGS